MLQVGPTDRLSKPNNVSMMRVKQQQQQLHGRPTSGVIMHGFQTVANPGQGRAKDQPAFYSPLFASVITTELSRLKQTTLGELFWQLDWKSRTTEQQEPEQDRHIENDPHRLPTLAIHV